MDCLKDENIVPGIKVDKVCSVSLLFSVRILVVLWRDLIILLCP